MQNQHLQWLKYFWPRSFSRQVILLTSLLISIGTAILTSYQVSEVSRYEYENSQQMLSAIAENLGLGISHQLIVRNFAEIEQLLLRASTYPGIRSITVIDSAGRVLSSVIREIGKPAVATYTNIIKLPPKNISPYFTWKYGVKDHGNPFALGLDATELNIWHPIENGGLGWLEINFSTEKVREDALQLLKISVFFALAGIVLMIALLSRFLKPNLRALHDATEFAQGLNQVRGQQIKAYTGSAEIEYLDNILNETSQRLYQQEVSIYETNSLLNNVLTAASEISIIATNLEGLITVFNRGAERLLGYTANEVIGILSPAPFHLPSEVSLRSQELSTLLGYKVEGFRVFVEIAERQGSDRQEWTYVKKSGDHVPVSLVITTMRNNDGTIYGYLGIAQDISELKRNDRMKSEFVSTVSHELRTPLTAIAGALGLISGGALGEMPEKIKQMLSIATKNSTRLTYLINDLLDMEKLVAGKMHFEMKPQYLIPLIEQSIESNKTYSADRRVTLKLNNNGINPEVVVDHHRLLQVLSNLISNAVKYSPLDDSVEIDISTHDQFVRVTVRDQGPGISEQFRNRIFGKFAQADSSDTRQKGGTGLGLAISRELIERMGGTIGFDSVEHQGASFYFDLPECIAHTVHPVTEIAPAAANAPRILVVEDEPDIAKLISIMLVRSGYQVDIALNGEKALKAINQTHYDAITLDLMLPDLSGFEVIKKLRSQTNTRALPIIVVSAKIEEGKLALNYDPGKINWLSKPIDEAQLVSAVESQLINIPIHRVLHIEDDADLHQVIRAMAGDRFQFSHAKTLHESRLQLVKIHFDLIILDINLPDGSAWKLLPEIRACQPNARIVILSGTDTTPEEALKVEAVLLKSQVSAHTLLEALKVHIKTQ